MRLAIPVCQYQIQMVNTKIRLILFFAAKDGEALYSQQKQDQELTVAQIMNSKMAVWGGLTNSCEKKRSEKQRRKRKIKASECRVPKNSKER